MTEQKENLLFCFSLSITTYIARCLTLLKTIIKEETSLALRHRSFVRGDFIYPLRLIAFEHPTELGFFNPDLSEIGMNKSLMTCDDETLKEVLRHEFAHYLTFIEYGNVSHHGKEFQSTCLKHGWKKEIGATIPLSSLKERKGEKIISKVTKLFDLASSRNPHEAEAAMTKARELLLKYGLQYTDLEPHYVVKRLLTAKRVSQKMRSISDILRLFFVYPIMNHGRESVYLEVLGNEIHVEIAEYIATFLDRTFEELWEREKEISRKGGLLLKNSFFAGLSHGFTQKHKNQKGDEPALILIQENLDKAVSMAYPNLSQSVRRGGQDSTAFSRGKTAGTHLDIRSPLKNQTEIKLVT